MPDRIRGQQQFTSYHYEHDTFIPPLKVMTIVKSQWAHGDSFANTNRPVFSMSVVTRGNACYVQNGKQGSVNTGDVYLAHKGSNQVFKAGPEGAMEKISIVAEGPVLDTILTSTGLSECEAVRPANPKLVARLFENVWRTMQQKKPGFTRSLSLIAHEILLELGRSIAAEPPAEIRPAIDFIKKNLGRSFTLEELCAHAKLSVRHCIRLFDKHLGCSPKQFFSRQRMSWAKSLLASTTMSVKQVAVTLGYEDPLYFSARFKQYEGVSPRAYRTRVSV